VKSDDLVDLLIFGGADDFAKTNSTVEYSECHCQFGCERRQFFSE
jgi:hypothetical protein